MATLPYADYLDDRSIIRPEPARVGEGEPSRLRLTGFAGKVFRGEHAIASDELPFPLPSPP